MFDQEIINHAFQFLVDGGETEAADILRTCMIEDSNVVDDCWDGSRQLDGILIDLLCPRRAYDVLSNRSHPNTKSIEQALHAVLPNGMYLKGIRVKATVTMETTSSHSQKPVSTNDNESLIQDIESQKALMIAVATGGPRIKDVNRDYVERRGKIKEALQRINISDPNSYSDLWSWYGKWSDGSLPTYQSRRTYITSLYQPLLDALRSVTKSMPIILIEPTGWARVDRNVEKIVHLMETAKDEEDFQGVGLLCRETIISLAQAVFDPDKHDSPDGATISDTDAKRILESYIAHELRGDSYDEHRRFAKAAYDLANKVQHSRTANFRDAALCAEATRSLINIIAIISGHRDKSKE